MAIKFALEMVDAMNLWLDKFIVNGTMPLQLSYIKGARICGSMCREGKEVFFSGNCASIPEGIAKGSTIRVKLSKIDVVEAKDELQIEFAGSFAGDLSCKNVVASTKKVVASRTFGA